MAIRQHVLHRAGGRRALCLLCALWLLPVSGRLSRAEAEGGAPQPSAEKTDLLVVSTHCDDELLYFGGTLPTYAGERGYAVQVVYMATGKALREREARAGLAVCGVTREPLFLGLKDKYSESLEDAEKYWDRAAVTETLSALIRQYRPEVILTHDSAGEYGHGAHMLTAACVIDAYALAADESRYPDSLAAYGAWQAQKLYLHLGKENPLTMDWRVPLAAFGSQTALEVANEAYQCHQSQLDYHEHVRDTGKYSCALFGLYFTQVGTDAVGGDFLENIPAERLTTYVPPTPSPTPEPTPPPTPSPAPEASAAPAPTAAPEPVENVVRTEAAFIWFIAGGAVLLCAAALLIMLLNRRRHG